MAGGTGLDENNRAGGALIEDMNNDGELDVVTTSWDLEDGMHYSRSNGDGTFTDLSVQSGLNQFKGGLHIMQTDYNNDGLKDIFVLRGAWKGKYGREPVSLLRNNGDGTFTDVTKEAGLLSLHPTQTAVWADFNNDGWLDVFVGAESFGGDQFPCELFINNHDGTFTECAYKANAGIVDFVKGVTAGDYNNDGWPDLFISSLSGEKRLLKNDGIRDGCVHFTDVSEAAGLKAQMMRVLSRPGSGIMTTMAGPISWSATMITKSRLESMRLRRRWAGLSARSGALRFSIITMTGQFYRCLRFDGPEPCRFCHGVKFWRHRQRRIS